MSMLCCHNRMYFSSGGLVTMLSSIILKGDFGIQISQAAGGCRPFRKSRHNRLGTCGFSEVLFRKFND